MTRPVAVDTPLHELRENPDNPRTIKPERLQALMRMMEEAPEHLYGRPLITTADGMILAGNMRWRAARELGWTTLPAVRLDLTPEKARLLMLRDNTDVGQWDEPALSEILRELGEAGADLELTGFEAERIEALLDRFEPTADDEANPDELPDEVPAITQAGELIELGPHRLICGDATDPEVMRRLLDGYQPVLTVTDPPYGVEYDGRWRADRRLTLHGEARGAMMGDERAGWSEVYAACASPVLYVWHAALRTRDAWDSVEEAGYEVRQQIVWRKPNFPIGRSHYQWQHEVALYAVRKGATAGWRGGHAQTTVWDVISPLSAYVWNANEIDETRTRAPTQKPALLFETPMLNHTHPGDVVVDPFCGSGTALIAADHLGRTCLAVEIDPTWCDLIRARYDNWSRGLRPRTLQMAEIIETPLSELHEWPRNPRSIDPLRLDALAAAMDAGREHVAVRPLIALADGTVIAGNMRLRAARDLLGWKTLPVVRLELDEQQAAQLALRDNAELGEWVEADVAVLLQGLEADGYDLRLTGFDGEQITDLLDHFAPRGGPLPEDEAEREIEASEEGRVYRLGVHRLVWADAGNAAVWSELLDSRHADLLLGRPPSESSSLEVYEALSLAAGWLKQGGPFYLFCYPPGELGLRRSLRAARLELHQELIRLAAGEAGLGEGYLQPTCEPVLYGWRAGGQHYFRGGRQQDSVWDESRLSASERAIMNSSVRGDSLVDPWGAPESLLAAEVLGRQARLICATPGLADHVRLRWAALTESREQVA